MITPRFPSPLSASLLASPTSLIPASSSQQASSSTASFADVLQQQLALPASATTASSTPAAANQAAITAELARIRQQGPVNRSREDSEFLLKHDARLAAIFAQRNAGGRISADDEDYSQRATGMVNTFAQLSDSEKALYDRAVASGNQAAADAIALVALTRLGTDTAASANGSYNPRHTAITPENITRYFSSSIQDTDGSHAIRFQALRDFLLQQKG